MLELEARPFIMLSAICALFYLARKAVAFQRNIRATNDWPGFRTLVSDRFLPFPFRVRGVSPGQQWTFYHKYDDYAKAGVDILSSVCVFPPSVSISIADPIVAKEVLGARARFPKADDVYKLLSTFGSNILVTEGDEWKRQRKITAPAFSEKNNTLVCDGTVSVLEDLFQNVWGAQKVVEVDNIIDLTVPITLLVVASAGFGRRSTWIEDQIAPPGHSMTFKEALHEVSHGLFLDILVPDWILRHGTPKMRAFKRANDEMGLYLREMIDARRNATVKVQRYDLFSSLLDANELELDGAARLTDDKLFGNTFLFLLAGYETTAHTLAYAFILLALYPDEQEAFYENIKAALPSDRTPTYDDFGSLSYAMAVLNETLRWFPPVVNIPKMSAEDTTFTTTNAAGEKTTVPIPRGAYVSITVPSLHHNPRYWDDPHAFKPARFLGSYPREAFLPFSGGPRGCIGRGFAETEGVAVLALLVARYRVRVRDEPRFAHETFAQRKARLLESQQSLTTYPACAPLVFERR